MAKRTGQKERQGGRELWDGKRIREVREERKLSRPQLAEASGVNEDDIGRHERNDPASNPSMDTLVRLALALKVRPGVLLEPTGTQIPRPEGEAGHDDRPTAGVALLEQMHLKRLEAEAPAEDSARGDILRAQHALSAAQAALNRALRRPDEKSGAA